MQPNHVLSAEAIVGLDLPPAALQALTTTGVPQELRLPDWSGPTLFTSEIGGGRLVATSEEGALVERTGADEAYILGSVRETEDDVPDPYAVFALRRGSGEVVLLDPNDPAGDRFVNTSLAAFLTAIEAFRSAFAKLVDDAPGRAVRVVAFRRVLQKLDEPCLDDADHYWPGWLEELE